MKGKVSSNYPAASVSVETFKLGLVLSGIK